MDNTYKIPSQEERDELFAEKLLPSPTKEEIHEHKEFHDNFFLENRAMRRRREQAERREARRVYRNSRR